MEEWRPGAVFVARAPGRPARQLEVGGAGLDRRRLLQWIFSWAGRRANWLSEDGEIENLGPTLRLAEFAAVDIENG